MLTLLCYIILFMKKLFILILITANLACFSQQNTFSKLYNPYNKSNSNSLGIAIEKKGNGYVTVAVGIDSVVNSMLNYKMNIIINETDSVGTLTKTTTFAGDSCDYWGGGHGSFVKTHDGGYCLAGSIDYNQNDTNIDHLIIRFDSNMNTLWTKVIDNDTMTDMMVQVCETYDNGFAFIGYRAINSSLWYVLLFKTDSLGNKLWQKTINMGYNCTASSILETPDKGFLIKGYRSWYIDGYGDPFVIKTDSIGNAKWSRIFGNPNQKDGSGAIAITNDGDYLFAYGYSTHTFYNNEGFLAQLNVIKLNPDGYTIWNRIYDTIRDNNCAMKILNLPDNNFVVMGIYGVNKFINNFNYIYYVSYLFKFNSSGDSLWKKTYNYTSDGLSRNLLFDNVIEPEGGLTSIGYIQTDTMHPSQMIWLLKTDSNGYAPGCYPTGVEEYITQKDGSISIFPNPVADDNLTITYSFSDIYKEIHLFINDASGRLVYQSTLYNTKGQHKLSVKDFASGSYICSFYHKDKLLNSVKFIKK